MAGKGSEGSDTSHLAARSGRAGHGRPTFTDLAKIFDGSRRVSSLALTGIFFIALVFFLRYAEAFVVPVVFAVLALFWIGTGLISFGPGWEPALEYLRAGGASEGLAQAAAMVGALADIVIGVGLAFRRTARHALFGAIAVSVFYLISGTFVLPQLWLEPLGPMLKILPIVVLNVVALAIVEDR